MARKTARAGDRVFYAGDVVYGERPQARDIGKVLEVYSHTSRHAGRALVEYPDGSTKVYDKHALHLANPATPTARRFVAAKIRKLRREGKPERAAVGEALAMGRRRGFRSIPKRRRGNPTTTVTPGNLKSESRVIGEQLNVLRYVHKYLMEHNAAGVAADVAGAVYALDELRAQASMGLHKNPRRRANPVLGLIANESPAVFTVSKRVKEIVYIHAQDGEEYVHPFAPGVSATFLQDGRCVLWRRDGKPVGGRRIGNTIRPIGG